MRTLIIGLLTILAVSCGQNTTAPISKRINKDFIVSLYENRALFVNPTSVVICPDASNDSIIHWTFTDPECQFEWQTEYHTSAVIRGDINHDGDIDIEDVSILIDYLNYDPISDYFYTSAADVSPYPNPDGNIDIEDLSNLIDFLFINGWSVYATGPCTQPNWYGNGTQLLRPTTHYYRTDTCEISY